MAAGVASGDCEARSVVECDAALVLLRRLTREGPLEERSLAWLEIDRLLDRRLELAEQGAK